MTRPEAWLKLLLTERKGTFRGMEIGMPLREALSLEEGERSRGRDSTLVRARLDESSWTECDVQAARLKGLDRVVRVRFTLTTERHFSDAEAAFELLRRHLARELGPAAPSAPDASGLPGRRVRALFKAQGYEVPTALLIEFRDGLDQDRIRSASVTVEMSRAPGT